MAKIIGEKIISIYNKKEATLQKMPKFNPYQTGCGIHKSKKDFSRNEEKQKLRKEIINNYEYDL